MRVIEKKMVEALNYDKKVYVIAYKAGYNGVDDVQKDNFTDIQTISHSHGYQSGVGNWCRDNEE